MERDTLLQLAKEKHPDLSLLCHLAKKSTPTPSLISEIFLPFFKKLGTYEYEIQVQLSNVFGIHGSKEQNAYWLNNTKLIPVVAHHWLMNQLMITPQEAITNNTRYQIKNALHHLTCNTRQQLEGLLEILLGQNKQYDKEILLLLKRGIQNSKLSYAVSEKVLHYLLTSQEYEIVYSTCALIKKYPFLFSSIPEVHLRRVMLRGGLYEPLALRTLGIWGNNLIFEEVIQGESWQLASKRVILPFLPLTTSLMNTLTQYLILHPTYSVDWLDGLLSGASQGVFISKKRIAAILQHYFEYEFIAAKQLVQLVGEQSKEELFNLVSANSDFDFQKRISLYQALNTPSARKKIVTHLKEIKDRTQLTILLDPIAELKLTEAEPYILPNLQHHPKICLEALKYIGSTKTIAHLKELLEFDAPVKQNIPSFEKEALSLLADLVPDQNIIIDYLQKHRLPHVNLTNLHLTRSVVNEGYLLGILEEEQISTVQYGIEKLGALGTLEALESVIKKIGKMDSDSSIQGWGSVTNPAWEAAKKIANRAYDQHKIRTKKSNPQTAVNTVLTEVLLKQFETPISQADATGYLNYISEVIPSTFPLEKLAILATSTNPHVIKFYISFLGKTNSNTAIIQLKEVLEIKQNIYTLRQALLALTALKNTSLEELVLPLLGHPNMNIKKTVAAYLTENGTVKAVPTMVQLFQRNNNTGLRTELEKGLKNILGDVYYFLLFNECFPCETAWQRELLESILTNDAAIKEEQYLDFPALNTIAPLEKIVPHPKMDEEFITNWKTIRSRTKEEVARFEKREDLLPKIETIRQQAGDVFITDLIAAALRKFDKAPLSKNFKTLLTNEEARLATAKNSSDIHLWDTLLLDPENEQIEYTNLIDGKEGKKKEKLFFHFLPHYGFQKIGTKLLEENQLSFLKKRLLNAEIAHPKYLPLFITFHDTLKKQGDENIISALETCIANHSFASKIHQEILFFGSATTEEKINKLAAYNAQQQSLLQEEILEIYKTCSWKQRNAVLQTIKTPANHTTLFELSFTHYLAGKKVDFGALSTTQIPQFENHPDAIELTKKVPGRLPNHRDEFILAYVKEVVGDQEADPSLLTSFRQLPTPRKWEILKTDIAHGNWHWFSFFSTFASINTELKKWFEKAPTEGKLAFLKRLVKTNKPLYFPQFEKEVLQFIKTSKEPIAWQLLFHLQLKGNEKELTTEFTQEYAGYTTSMKNELLTHLLHTLPTTFVPSSIFTTLVPTDKKEKMLLIQLQLKTLDYTLLNTDIVIDLIRQLANQDPALANQRLTEMLESSADIGVEKQMKMLSAGYAIPELNNTVTTQIADLFSTERLALSFLTEAQKKQFYKQIGDLLNVKNTEINKKGLLKNLADESPEATAVLLLRILSSKKKTDLDSLCLRLLKKTTTKAAYLDTCYSLLSSKKESLFSSILKTLSFASYSAAIPTFIKLLSHKTLAKGARKGLLIFGEQAIPLLTKEVNKARPDKRATLNKLLGEIERKRGI